HWATQEKFDELERAGLMMFGQMTAGSWIYIGTQGILQGTYETFAECARQHFGGTLAGRLCVTAGCGGMGGAQPLAITMNDGVCIGVDCNAVRLLQRLLDRGVTPDALTDQTSAHDPLHGYIPEEMTLREAEYMRQRDPDRYLRLSGATMERHVRQMVELHRRGAVTFDYGNNIRQRAHEHGVEEAFEYPGFVPAFIRPQFCVGRGPFRWVALSGDPRDISATDHELRELCPDDPALHRWILSCRNAPSALRAVEFDDCSPAFGFQGLPARIGW